MYRYLICFVMLLSALSAGAADRLDSIYRCLDEAIDRSADYVGVRERRIDSLAGLVASARTDAERYEREMSLFMEYKPYCNDSAMASIGRCIALAARMGLRDEEVRCRSMLAFQCSTTGMYTESLDILGRIDTSGVGREAMGEYYLAYAHVYGELMYYGSLDQLKARYGTEQARYVGLALGVLDRQGDAYRQRMEMLCYADNDMEKALRINDERLATVEEGSHGYAIVAFYRYMDYKQMGRMEEAKYWLAMAALSDVRNAVMDQAALWELANLLNQEGQLSRSYRYIGFAWESAVKFGTRMRNWQISPILQTIDKNYQAETEHSNMMLRLLAGIVSVMAVLLLALLVYMARQRNRLVAAHKELSRSSEMLSGLNDELRQANGSLDEANRQLQSTIALLNEQTRVKEEYIGRFMRLCSRYIDRNDDFRKRVNKMLKSREYETLWQMTKTGEMKDRELEELYANFDAAFLHLFPNFVDDFNSLLKPEERVVTDGDRLNTTLRIFALIRLGIGDSSTIAEFLHYSVNTIYNYRARVKNGALDGRGSFENKVKEIGMPQ